jgi:hypothetical protein
MLKIPGTLKFALMVSMIVASSVLRDYLVLQLSSIDMWRLGCATTMLILAANRLIADAD